MNRTQRAYRFTTFTGLAVVGGLALQAQTAHAAGSASLVYAVYTPANRAVMAVDDQSRLYVSGFYRYPAPLPWPPPIGAPSGPPYGPYPDSYLEGDTFIVGHDPSGQVVYKAFVPGPAIDYAQALVARSQVIYVARQEVDTEGSWGTVVKLQADVVSPPLSSSLVISGHSASVNDMVVDSAGIAYVTGQTGNRTYDNYSPYATAAYVTKVDAGGAVHPIRELDGAGYEAGLGIDVDQEGDIYVTGTTSSPDFPVVGGQASGGRFVVKLDPSGAIVYSTRLGDEWGEILKVAAAGNGDTYLVGTTSSAVFPVTPGALDPTLNGSRDPYLARLDPSGRLVYATYLGGEGAESLVGAVFGPAGSLYLAGSGQGPGSPLVDPRSPGCQDNFISRLDIASGAWVSTCLPGVRVDGLAVDRKGDAYVAGVVSSAGVFPADGVGKSFVARIAFNRPPDCSAAFASPATLWPPDGRLVPVSIRNVTDPDGDPVAITVTGVRQDEPLRGTANAFGIGTPDVSVRADRDGKGDGRVYLLSFTATDPQGASCTGTVTVRVPHDQGQGRSCVDGGGLFNSGG